MMPLFDAVLPTMIASNFDMFKRINDNEDFDNLFDIFDQVYEDISNTSNLAGDPSTSV
jgi:hypothetical protein